MIFNRSRTKDFNPEIYIDENLLDVVETVKLVGVILSSDLKWDKNVNYMCQKAQKRLWSLRRIKDLSGSIDDLLTVFTLQIRVLLETAVGAWNGALTLKNIKQMERIQISAAKIMLGEKFRSYKSALKILNLNTLEDRRKQLCLSFARKASRNKKNKPWFKQPARRSRGTPPYFIPATRTAALRKSPLFYLAQLLNENTYKQ